MRVLVTGASSLIGRGVVASLLARGDSVVTLHRSAKELPGADHVQGSVTNPHAVGKAVAGCDAVVHLAARVGITGSWDQFFETNVVGTRRILDGARSAGVSRFVHVSSPSVAHGGEALVAAPAGPADASATKGHYATSKAIAEGESLVRHSESMAVVVIRPHLVWGPGDTQLVGRIVDRARSGRLAIVGTGAALIDSTYIDNAVDALVAAVDRADTAGGRALVVSNGEPRPIADLIAGILKAHGLAAPKRHVPMPLALGAGWLAERAWTVLSLGGEPPMTRFLAEQMGTAHWFDQQQTRELLDWEPKVTLDEGLRRLSAGSTLAGSAAGGGG